MVIKKRANHLFCLIYLVTTYFSTFIIFFPLIIPLSIAGFFSKKAWHLFGNFFYVLNKWTLDLQPFKNRNFCLEGLETLKGRKVLLVSNHRSNLDVFLLLSCFKNLRLASKSELFNVPILGIMMSLTKQIKFKRANLNEFYKSLEIGKESLNSGDPTLFFPEMTRCPHKFKGTQRFHLYPFKMAKDEGAYVYPIVIKGSDEVWPKGYMGIDFRKDVSIKLLNPLNSKDYDSAFELAKEVRNLIEKELNQ